MLSGGGGGGGGVATVKSVCTCVYYYDRLQRHCSTYQRTSLQCTSAQPNGNSKLFVYCSVLFCSIRMEQIRMAEKITKHNVISRSKAIWKDVRNLAWTSACVRVLRASDDALWNENCLQEKMEKKTLKEQHLLLLVESSMVRHSIPSVSQSVSFDYFQRIRRRAPCIRNEQDNCIDRTFFRTAFRTAASTSVIGLCLGTKEHKVQRWRRRRRQRRPKIRRKRK